MIFVSIASFRDKQLIKTVKSCLLNATPTKEAYSGVIPQYI